MKKFIIFFLTLSSLTTVFAKESFESTTEEEDLAFYNYSYSCEKYEVPADTCLIFSRDHECELRDNIQPPMFMPIPLSFDPSDYQWRCKTKIRQVNLQTLESKLTYMYSSNNAGTLFTGRNKALRILKNKVGELEQFECK